MEYKNKDGLTEEEFLKLYKPKDYEKPSVTVDIALINKENNDRLKLLLIKRKNHPYINTWALPGGFVDIDEDIDEAVKRELLEETNVDNIHIRQLYTYGAVNRDPRMRVISVSYIGLLSQNSTPVKAGDDAKEALWFDVKKELVAFNEDETIYNLKLSNNEKNIKIAYLIIERKTDNPLNPIEYDIKPIWTCDRLLAFDHIEIVNNALHVIDNIKL